MSLSPPPGRFVPQPTAGVDIVGPPAEGAVTAPFRNDPFAAPPEGTSGGAAGQIPAAELLAELVPFVTPQTTDLLLNGPELWRDEGRGLVRQTGWPRLPEERTRELAVRLIARGGRHLDDASPCVDVRLPGGVRVHAVLPPVSVDRTLVSIRLPNPSRLRLADLVRLGSVGERHADLLVRAVADRRNILLTGAGGSGKTTLLGALLAEVPATERIVTVEDVSELRIDHPHVVGLEARQPNTEGAGGIGLDRLLREALRMRPDRLVLGECRGAELRELLTALNTGHDGGAGTLHANRLEDVPARLEALAALTGMGPAALGRQAVSALHLVVHLDRTPEGRRVAGIGRLRLEPTGDLVVEELR